MAQALAKAMATATTFTVSWNCMNLAMESYTFLPQITDLTMEEKLSSVRMMSEASLATSVPAMPMAKPTSAILRAGASLVPSPVTATTSRLGCSLLSMMCFTRMYLSVGVIRARTFNLGQTVSNLA